MQIQHNYMKMKVIMMSNNDINNSIDDDYYYFDGVHLNIHTFLAS